MPRALLPFPPLPGARPAPVRRAVGPRHQRPGHLHGPRRDRRGDLLVGHRAAAGRAGRAPRDDAVLRLRDRVLVHRAARDDLVPGAHRGGRADVPGDRPGGPRRSGVSRRRRDRGRDGPRSGPAEPPLPAPHRATPVRRRLPVRSRLHRPPDRRLRRAVLRLRRRRWRLAAPRLVGRSRRGGPDPGPRPVRPGHDRPARQPGVRPPVPARDGRLPDARLPRRLGGRGPALPAPERRAGPVRHAGRAAGRASRTRSASTPSRSARIRRRRAACSTRRARWPCRATPA